MNARLLRVTKVADANETAGVVRIRAAGEIDMFSVPLLDDALATAAAGGYREIHLDLAEVTFFDCAALRALEVADDAAPGRLRLVAAGEPVRLVLHLLDRQGRFVSA
ncbi:MULTISPECIES: STAS domain-containing protein [Micromonospora]|uniref:STAS domain-containing protein n=1 Tax=Micromonospora TaxID=1873 RepID=UPI0001BF16FE|nr:MULTISPECIES: STAS domain-containing protein [Micromonospora]ADL49527.1 Sulfate transporter/antisigma-factor antagonist STAS [Micromonospora aurantiaca ATCC 27029]